MAFIIVCGGSYGATERRAGAPRHEHINENKNANYLLWNGNRVQIKRVQFEHFIDGLEAI